MGDDGAEMTAGLLALHLGSAVRSTPAEAPCGHFGFALPFTSFGTRSRDALRASLPGPLGDSPQAPRFSVTVRALTANS